jgi:hypothetical protein
MLCADATELTVDELSSIANTIADHQHSQLATAVANVLARLTSPCELVMSAGEGAFLTERVAAECQELAGIPRISLSGTLGPEHSQAACYALADWPANFDATKTTSSLSSPLLLCSFAPLALQLTARAHGLESEPLRARPCGVTSTTAAVRHAQSASIDPSAEAM